MVCSDSVHSDFWHFIYHLLTYLFIYLLTYLLTSSVSSNVSLCDGFLVFLATIS